MLFSFSIAVARYLEELTIRTRCLSYALLRASASFVVLADLRFGRSCNRHAHWSPPFSNSPPSVLADQCHVSVTNRVLKLTGMEADYAVDANGQILHFPLFIGTAWCDISLDVGADVGVRG